MKLEIHKTDVLGVGPWYVTPKDGVDVLGTFREYKDAQLFACAPEMYEALMGVDPDILYEIFNKKEVKS